VHVRLADDDRPGLPKLRDLKGIVGRHVAREGKRAPGRRHADRVVVVLQNYGDAVHGSPWTVLRSLSIQGLSLGDRIRIQPDDGIDRRSSLIVRLDTGQVRPSDLDRSHPTGRHRVLKLGDRGASDLHLRGDGRREDGGAGDRAAPRDNENEREPNVFLYHRAKLRTDDAGASLWA